MDSEGEDVTQAWKACTVKIVPVPVESAGLRSRVEGEWCGGMSGACSEVEGPRFGDSVLGRAKARAAKSEVSVVVRCMAVDWNER
jgi:hypothetical protein